MTTIIERVARAIGEAMIQDGKPGALELDYPWLEDGDSNNAYNLEDMAKAAISALRDPTDEMVEVGQEENNLLENPDPPNAFKFLSREEMTNAWQAMVDRALDKPTEHPQ